MTLGREKLCFLNTPTPLERLNRLSEELGVNFYLKRDDLTSFGTGGNKLRKLEYLVKDAQSQGATMLLTVGGAQTNHGRLTAAVAARYSMRSAIVAVDPYPGEISANLLLDGIMGCSVYLIKPEPNRSAGEVQAEAVRRVTAQWEEKGEKVYFIPTGGSNELGALGYYDCAVELAEQTKALGLEQPRLFTTAGSLGTYMGLQLGIKNEKLPLRLTGIGIMPFKNGIVSEAVAYYQRIKTFYSLELDIAPEEFDLIADYDCGGYNNPVREVREAIYLMGRREGIILDPCYTGKTFAGILDMIKTGKIRQGETIIMLHTGGMPGIYTKHHRVEMEKELQNYIHIVDLHAQK